MFFIQNIRQNKMYLLIYQDHLSCYSKTLLVIALIRIDWYMWAIVFRNF